MNRTNEEVSPPPTTKLEQNLDLIAAQANVGEYDNSSQVDFVQEGIKIHGHFTDLTSFSLIWLSEDEE